MTSRACFLAFVCASSFAQYAQAGEDDALNAAVEACDSKGDGWCLLRLGAFEEAASVFEASPATLLDAVSLRRQLGQHALAYTDALTFARGSRRTSDTERAAAQVFTLLEDFEDAGDDVSTADFLQRYLRDFGDRGPADLALVAHAKLGALLMKQSCPIATFHGACVEVVRERRQCPELAEGPFKPQPIFNQHEPRRTAYSVDLARSNRRDPHLLREATKHLNEVINPRRDAPAERDTLGSPARQRALANAKAQAMLDLATPLLDAFIALGGVPENLSFDSPTQFDNACERQRKKQALEWSSHQFMRWLLSKHTLARKLFVSTHQAIAIAGPEAAIAATARLAIVERFVLQALFEPDTLWIDCPFAGFREHDIRGSVFEQNEQAASQGCLRLASIFAIDDRWTGYCRWAAGQYSGRSDLIREMFPSELWMEHVHDDVAPERYQPKVLDPQPRLRPRPPKFTCNRTSKSTVGVLGMYDGHDLADMFQSREPFTASFPAKLVERYSP